MADGAGRLHCKVGDSSVTVPGLAAIVFYRLRVWCVPRVTGLTIHFVYLGQ